MTEMDNYDELTREQLISQVKSLRSHNLQLQNIIKRSEGTHLSRKKHQKPFDFQKCEFRHVLLKFFYLGWDYQGYVVQEDTANTIEHHIFEALLKTCLIEKRENANYHRCGRTDKGVSSFSQVISLDIRYKSGGEELNYCKMLNSVLPGDIQFVAWVPVNENFSARFDCSNRVYKYFFPKGNLDIESMKLAAKYLEGSHDFRNFCKMDVNNGVTEFVRTIVSVNITCLHEDRDDNFSMYVFTVKGQNKEDPKIVLELLDINKNPRKPDYNMASEIPLNLYDCVYENVQWIYDPEALNIVGRKLHTFWTFSTVKSAMIQNMLLDLGKEIGGEYDFQSDCLIPGVKAKTYVPVMKRQLCDSLEDKITHCSKRRKRKD